VFFEWAIETAVLGCGRFGRPCISEKDHESAMSLVKTVLKFVLAAFFIFAGIGHFRDEAFFLKIMPDYIPAAGHLPAVHVSGACEILLGVLLLIPSTMRLAAWGLVALLVAVFPANVYAYQHSREIFPSLDPALHFWRLPMQGVLIAWAWWYTRPSGASRTVVKPDVEVSQ
jgi:uncharacterized membrane protein